MADRKTTFSKIKFRPNSADNQATYACEVGETFPDPHNILMLLVSHCGSHLYFSVSGHYGHVSPFQADHPALRGEAGRPGSPMRSSVLLSVQCKCSQTSVLINGRASNPRMSSAFVIIMYVFYTFLQQK